MTQGPYTRRAFTELATRLAEIDTHVGHMIRSAESCMADGLPPTREDTGELLHYQKELAQLAKELSRYTVAFDQAVHYDKKTTETQ